MPIKVEQIKEYLFSDTVQSKKKAYTHNVELAEVARRIFLALYSAYHVEAVHRKIV